MHSIIDKNNNCVGQYIFIKDDKYSTRIFTRFYNMCISKEFPIEHSTIRDLIKMKKYNLENTIHIYDLNTNEMALKHLTIGSIMVYLNTVNRIYLCTEEDLYNFLKGNEYSSLESVVYVLGIPDGEKFKDVRPISANNVENAKLIYKKRYGSEEEPIIIGIKESEHLYINLNSHVLETSIDESTITKPE